VFGDILMGMQRMRVFPGVDLDMPLRVLLLALYLENSLSELRLFVVPDPDMMGNRLPSTIHV
jgi:hypothetical protein